MRYLQKTILFLAGAALAISAQASTLESYFDFTKYGTVAGGNQITSNIYGSATATVQSTATSLTSGGLTITGGTNAETTGVTLAGDQLTSFNEDFSFQIWYTSPASILNNTILFGGTTTASKHGNLSGDQALFVGYFTRASSYIRAVIGNNTKYGAILSPPSGTGTAPSTLYDYVLTYTASTHTFSTYLNGALIGTPLSVSYFAGLSGLTSGFSIGGVANPAFDDKAAGITISSALFYDGALTATEVFKIDGFGASATVAQLQSAGISTIPEPLYLRHGLWHPAAPR